MASQMLKRAAMKPSARPDAPATSRTASRPVAVQRPQTREVAAEPHQGPNQLGAGLAAAVTAVALLVSAPSAQAVSGGGGISGPVSGMDFSGQDLRKRSFTKAVMRKTIFRGANLQGVSFFGGLAPGADFHGADLTNADLESGDFVGADFSDAILVGAYANNAQFEDINIENSDWTDVQLRRDINKYLCTLAKGTNPKTGVDTRESLNCP